MEKKADRIIIFPLIGLLCVNILMYSKIRNLENRIDGLYNRLDQTRSSLSNSIDGISYNISREMEKSASIVNSFNYEYGSIKDGNIDIILSVSPKSVSASDKYYFSYKVGNNPAKLVEARSNDGVNYSSAISASIKDNIDLSLVIEDGTTKKVEELDNIQPIGEKLESSFMIGERRGPIYQHPGKRLSFKNALYSLEHIVDNNDERHYLSEVKLIFEHNENIVKTYTMKIDDMRSSDYFDSYSVTIDDFLVNLETNDVFEIYITAKDKRGFNIKAPVEKIIIDKNGTRSPEPRNEVIIY